MTPGQNDKLIKQ